MVTPPVSVLSRLAGLQTAGGSGEEGNVPPGDWARPYLSREPRDTILSRERQKRRIVC